MPHDAIADGLPEARAARRFRVYLPAMVEAVPPGGRRAIGMAANLSLTGAYVASPVLFPVGAPLRLSLVLPLTLGAPELHRLTAEVRVRWANDPAAPKAPGLPGGMGLEFVGLAPAARAHLQALLDRRLAAPDWDPLTIPDLEAGRAMLLTLRAQPEAEAAR
jgi:hypothetical protein